MAVLPSLFTFFLLSYLMFLHSSGEAKCPDSFDCGNHRQIKFPFTSTAFPECGLITVNCTELVPQLNFGVEGLWYELVNNSNFSGDSITVKDPRLGYLISTKGCDLFSFFLYSTLAKKSSISFTISPALTLYKCTNISQELNKENEVFFHGSDSYGGCKGYTVYYRYRNGHPFSNFSHFPANCTVTQLPAVWDIGNRISRDLFTVLTSEFSIRFNVSKECRECRHKGGQCARDTPVFQCFREGNLSPLPLVLGTVAAGIVIFVILLFCIIRKLPLSEYSLFWKNRTENCRNIEAFLKNCGSLSPKRYTYSDIKKMTNSFRTKLGQGGYGCVFKGKVENGGLVAVKVLNGLKGSGEEFINEVATISRTSHVNVVTLLGFCFEGRHRALIYEFMPNGSLDRFIHGGDSSIYHQLGWEALYQIAVGIARGLEYLHRGCNTRILHFDIKPHNILLDNDFSPKISDFGLAKLCPQKESTISLLDTRGTIGYIAPEVFSRIFGAVSHKSDVYSYGMMILEMVGVRKNPSVEVGRTSEIYFPHWIYKRLELDEELGLHGVMNDEANEIARKMIIVGLWCIQTDPLHRPSVSRVLDMLEGSSETSLQVPPKPFFSSPVRLPVDSLCSTMSMMS